MQLLFRIAVLVPVLFLIALVVMGQFHVTAQETIRAAVRRTGRWLLWIGILVVAMLAIEFVLIGW
jgi:hypothetical protein